MNNSEKIEIIAEIGMNHEGSLGQAMMLTKAAKENGADAVKFQMHISDEETLKDAPSPPYFKSESRYEYFNRTAFTVSEWKALREYCKEINVSFIVSPFSIEAVKRLCDLNVDAIKIPSGEVTNIPYIEYISSIVNVPVILSTGMNTLDEVEQAYNILKNKELSILQCSSEYPCKAENLGLNVIDELKDRFPGIKIGLSDHSDNIWSSVIAVSKGIYAVERHFTLSKKMYGPDAYMSLEPDELLQLRRALDYSAVAYNSKVDKNDISKYEDMRKVFQKSIVANRNIYKGEIITEEMLAYKKPGTGMPAKDYKLLVGCKCIKDMVKDEMFKSEDY